MNKIATTKHVLIETIAGQLAATWYEIGKAQGLTSKYPDARSYARAYLHKFIPKAVEYCLEMLKSTSNATREMKEEIYDALQERHNDPELLRYRPNIDVNKVIEMVAEMERKKGPVIINTGELDQDEPKTVLHNPFKATRH